MCHVVVLCDFGQVGQILSLVFVFLTCKMEGLEFVLDTPLLAQTFLHRSLVTGP